MSVPEALKRFSTIDQQLQLLESRGLQVDSRQARRWLVAVGYYRLSGYWYTYRRTEQASATRSDSFTGGVKFDDIARLYEFDRKLRTLLFDGTERVEVALRSSLGYVLGQRTPLAYRDRSAFRSTFDHAAWLGLAERRADRARRHNDSIRHHDSRYGGELPIWVLVDVLDLSDASRLFAGMESRDQRSVAESMGVTLDLTKLRSNQRKKALAVHPLAAWLEQLTILRNVCAHHARVWNRSLIPTGTPALRTVPELGGLPSGQSDRVWGAILVIAHVLQTTSPGSTWTTKVETLLTDSFIGLRDRHISEIGAPEDWRSWLSSTRPTDEAGQRRLSMEAGSGADAARAAARESDTLSDKNPVEVTETARNDPS